MPFTPPDSFNIAQYFLDARIEEGRGERRALVCDDRELTYREVQSEANRFGRVLLALGVEPEERVMVALPDSPELVAAIFGTLKIGAVVVPVNPSLGAERIAQLYSYTRARLLVVDGDFLEPFALAARAGSHALRHILVVGGDAGAHVSYEECAQEADDRLETAATHRDDVAIWLFSGGTTGRPKAVLQTHRSYANTTECYAKRGVGYREDDLTLSVPSLYFGYALGCNLFFPFAVGASAVLYREPATVERLFEMIRRHRPSILVNVPTMVNRMVNDAAAAEQDLSSLRFAVSAGEALPAPLYHRWLETFGTELLDGLGTAEMWHIFLSNLPGSVRPGTLGRAVPGFEIEVRDPEGRALAAGEVGHLWVRGDSRAIAYWQNMEETRATFRGDWVALGDLVQMDEEGYVTYCGRADDVLKVDGKWCAPQEVESCLLEHPEVKECAVVGAANAEGLLKPYAFVVPQEERPGLAEALKEHVLSRLAAYKHPRRVILLSTLPRTHLGKIDRGKLKVMV